MSGIFKPDDLDIRYNLVDVYPRKTDPFRGPGLPSPSDVPATSLGYELPPEPGTIMAGTITQPGPRPIVFQQASNYSVNLAANTAQRIMPNTFPCDTIVFDVYNAVAVSAFVGYGQVTLTSGLEIRPGLPIVLQPDNTREQWELQRALEGIYAVVASGIDLPPLPKYKAPRVVFDASQFWLISTAAISVSIMIFGIPEFQ